jgi:hypothetical protein
VSAIPGVLDVEIHRGASARADAAPDLLIEVPHGATRTSDFTALAVRLTSPLPRDLVDFFHVNTDAGAPELAVAIARRFVAANPCRVAAVLCARIPRTFIDCNRRVDASPEEFRAGKVTPGLMPWITTAEDRALLLGLYADYVAAVRAAVEAAMPRGALLLLHSYAPREVGVEVDDRIVESLRAAYAPDVEPTWPLRPEVDVIGCDLDGRDWSPAPAVERLRARLAEAGVTMANGVTYPLHPSTLAHGHVVSCPGRALCVEVRRDLLADPFTPFAQMRIGAEKVERLAAAFAPALEALFG